MIYCRIFLVIHLSKALACKSFLKERENNVLVMEDGLEWKCGGDELGDIYNLNWRSSAGMNGKDSNTLQIFGMGVMYTSVNYK